MVRRLTHSGRREQLFRQHHASARVLIRDSFTVHALAVIIMKGIRIVFMGAKSGAAAQPNPASFIHSNYHAHEEVDNA